MYYRFTATLKPEFVSTDRDTLRQINSQQSKKYNYRYRRGLDISFYYFESNTISLLAKTNTNFERRHKISEIVDLYFKACNLEYESIRYEFLTATAIRVMEEDSQKRALSRIMNEISDRDFLRRISNRVHNGCLYFRDTLVTEEPEMDALVFEKVYKEEVKRIRDSSSDTFLGHPVHYLFTTSQDIDVQVCAESLTYELFKHKRILAPQLAILEFVDVEYHHETSYEIESVLPMCEGGVLMLNFISSPLAVLSAEIMKNACAVIAQSIIKTRHEVMFVLVGQENSIVMQALREELYQLSFVHFTEEIFGKRKAINYLNAMLKKYNIDPKKAIDILPKEMEKFRAIDLNQGFADWYEKYLREEQFAQYHEFKAERRIIAEIPQGEAYRQLQSLIGLEDVKAMVDRFLNAHRAQILYAQHGVKIKQTSKHMVFTGEPGTAKTTVARLIGKIMRDNHLLTIGDFHEVHRSKLIEKYVGWTARQITKIFREAEGSVIFIDEAYALMDEHSNSFGQEAINTIVYEMENWRDSVMVIFAGYPDKMNEFIQSNPGLRSRINFTVDFKNYSIVELTEIAKLMAKEQGFTIEAQALHAISRACLVAMRRPNFGNARFVRNLVEQAIIQHGATLYNATDPTKEEVTTLRSEDFACLTSESMPIIEMNQQPQIKRR